MLARRSSLVRLGLLLFVLAWLFASDLRSAIPIWLPFLIALGLELHFFAGAFREAPVREPDRGPQAVDIEHLGYDLEDEELDDPFAEEEDAELEPEYVYEGPPRNPLRSFLVGLGVIGLLALVLVVVDRGSGWNGLDDTEQASASERLSEEASLVAEKRVSIRCDESGGRVGAVQHTDGIAFVGGNVAYLTPERCFDLYRLAYKHEEASNRTGRALAVLAHEAWHLRGVSDEGRTECYALQSGVDVGRRLGLSAGTARRLMRQQLAENTLRTGSSSEYRVPPDCRDGGALDLNPDRSSFP
jgi:hypothetical protein